MPLIPLALTDRYKRREPWPVPNRPGESGYTIVELMVAITIGLLILTALIAILVQSIQARAEVERGAQQIENGRYAMQLLTDDLRNAGYLAAFDPTPLATPATKPDPCAVDLATLRTALPLAVQGYDNGTGAPGCVSDVRAGTDIVVVRRASTCAVGAAGCDGAVAGAPYFQASACGSATELSSADVANYYALDTNTASLTRHQKDCNPPGTPGTLAPYYQYRTHVYFVANNDKPGDGIPTLKRAELGASLFTIKPLVQGIENLQIEYGIETGATLTGTPSVFTADPDSYSACAVVDCARYWRNTVAARVSIVARNTTRSAGVSSDPKTYVLGLNFNGTSNTVGPFTDGYKRHVYTSSVRLNNVGGRNAQ
jgi:type IV pilus assembly protein PilW